MKTKILLFVLLAFSISCKSQNFFWSHTKTGFTVKYGALYNFYAATDSRNITSSDDWVVPTITQWNTLATYVGGTSIAGGKLKETGFQYWNSPNTGATNEFYFNGRGAGYRSASGSFNAIKGIAYIHSTTIKRPFLMNSTNDDGFVTNLSTDLGKDGFSIRLLYTGSGTPTSYTGNDGKVYGVVTIGTQTWLADNLCETKFRNGDVIPWHGANPANYFTNAEWAALTTAGVCAYDNNLSNVASGFTFP